MTEKNKINSKDLLKFVSAELIKYCEENPDEPYDINDIISKTILFTLKYITKLLKETKSALYLEDYE